MFTRVLGRAAFRVTRARRLWQNSPLRAHKSLGLLICRWRVLAEQNRIGTTNLRVSGSNPKWVAGVRFERMTSGLRVAIVQPIQLTSGPREIRWPGAIRWQRTWYGPLHLSYTGRFRQSRDSVRGVTAAPGVPPDHTHLDRQSRAGQRPEASSSLAMSGQPAGPAGGHRANPECIQFGRGQYTQT